MLICPGKKDYIYIALLQKILSEVQCLAQRHFEIWTGKVEAKPATKQSNDDLLSLHC